MNYTPWKLLIDSPNCLRSLVWAIEVGSGDDAITLIRTPARYSSFNASATDPPPAVGQHNDMFLTGFLSEQETAS